MKISILILTHNRPMLFTRAISSVLNTLPGYDVEIIVNNDSCDITEVNDDRVTIKYFYVKSHDLSDIYKFLFDQATGEFVYYLEDDDYIKPDFFCHLNLNADINFMEYVSEPLIREKGVLASYKDMTKNRKASKTVDAQQFISWFDDEEFQLGQILFRKSLVTNFPTGNHLNNDYQLFKHIAIKCKMFYYINKQTWVQTTDGYDNISFPEMNKQSRFTAV